MKKSKWRRWILGAMIYTGAYFSLLTYAKTIGDGKWFIRMIIGLALSAEFIWYGYLCGAED